MSTRSEYYNQMRALALEKREEFSVCTAAFGLRELRAIYRVEGITIDQRKLPYRIKAIYMCGDKNLPVAPRLFALVHELKHHWVDQELIESGELQCGDYNQNELEEKGAEVFAAEFIYPEEEFAADISRSGISDWDVDAIVRFKREFCRAKVSYTYIRKRLEWLSMIGLGEFADVRFQAREEELHGIPFYKQPGYQMRRRMKVRAR